MNSGAGDSLNAGRQLVGDNVPLQQAVVKADYPTDGSKRQSILVYFLVSSQNTNSHNDD